MKAISRGSRSSIRCGLRPETQPNLRRRLRRRPNDPVAQPDEHLIPDQAACRFESCRDRHFASSSQASSPPFLPCGDHDLRAFRWSVRRLSPPPAARATRPLLSDPVAQLDEHLITDQAACRFDSCRDRQNLLPVSVTPEYHNRVKLVQKSPALGTRTPVGGTPHPDHSNVRALSDETESCQWRNGALFTSPGRRGRPRSCAPGEGRSTSR
jgi:hypothetical protein